MFGASIEFLSNTNVTLDTKTIETIDGQTYNKRLFDSSIHELFSTKLLDIEKAAFLYEKHKQIVLPILQNDSTALEAWKDWLKENLFLVQLGSSHLSKQIPDHPVLKNYHVCLKEFLTQVNEEKPLNEAVFHKIAIIAPPAINAVGENMVAEALEKYLCSLGKEAKILMPANETDSLFRFARMNEANVWCEVYQKRNDRVLARKCWNTVSLLPSFIPTDTLGGLRKQIESFAPDFIITTRYSNLDHVTLSAQCPMAFLTCDHSFLHGSDNFSPYLLKLIGNVSSQRVKYWVPSQDCIPKSLTQYIDVLGYPLRSSINRVENTSAYLDKWDVKPKEKVILLQMGKQGMGGSLPSVIENIFFSSDSLPSLYLIALVGDNKVMKEEILKVVEKFPKVSTIRVHLCDALSGEEMGELYNVASAMIGKAGGVTTAEVIHMNVPSLVFPSWDLEKTNVRHLVKIGLGIELKDFNYVAEPLNTLLQQKPVKIDSVDWQERLPTLFTSYQKKNNL